MAKLGVDPTRYTALAAVLLMLACLIGLSDVALHAALGLAPRELSRTEYLNPEYRQELGARVSSVEQEFASRSSEQPPLGVILGLSTVREGVVESELERQDAHGLRWLNLGGSGASFYELAYYTHVLAVSSLRPKIIVIGAHPFLMAGRILTPRRIDSSPSAVLAALRERDSAGAAERLKRWSWLVFNRNRLTLNLQRALAAAHMQLFQGFGLPLSSVFPPSPNPWLVSRRYEGRAAEGVLATQMSQWQGFRWFDASRYTEDSVEIEAFQRLLRDCRRISDRVIVLEMPEAQALRIRMPPVARTTLEEAARSFDRELELVDLSGALPEDAFHDYTHVASNGRALLTAKLVEYLKRGSGAAGGSGPPAAQMPTP